MQSTSPELSTSRPRGRPPKPRSERQQWLESILPGRYNGYDVIRRYNLLEEGLDDREFHARVIAAIEKHKEMQKYTPRRKNGNGVNFAVSR